MTSTPRLRQALRAAAAVLSVVVIIAVFRALKSDGPAALDAWHSATVRWNWIALATACALSGHAIYVLGWRRLLHDCGVPISFWQAARFFLVSNLGRYIPGGKAWQMSIVGVMAAENELPATLVAATSLLQGAVGIVVGAILLLATGGAALGVATAWFVLPVAGVVCLLAAPAVLRSIPRAWTAIVQRLPSIDSVSSATMWALVWTTAASWIAWGIALDTLARGLLPDPGAPVIAYVAAWIGSFSAGIVAVVAPAGFGVRDGVMGAMLKTAGVSAGGVVIVVVVARVWVTVLDVVPAVAVLMIRQRGRRVQPGTGAPDQRR